jgi:predicted transcriptional regulator
MDASRTLARLERALTTRGVSLKDFLASHDLPPSTFYKAKSTNNISPQLNKRYLTALRQFEPAQAEDGQDVAAQDMVNSPSHYKLAGGGAECIDVMVQLYGLKRVQEYAEIAAFKYAWREGRKGDSSTDKRKKIWYTRFSMGDDPRVSADV